MALKENSRRYLKGISYGLSLEEDSLTKIKAVKLAKKLKKKGYKVSIRYSNKYEDYSVWSNR